MLKYRIKRKFLLKPKEINGIKKCFWFVKIKQELIKKVYYKPYEKEFIEEYIWEDKNFV